MAQSIDCDTKQVIEMKTETIDNAGQSKSDIHIKGRIKTDDWEMRILLGKFKEIIPQRILSKNIQNICSMEDPPRIYRFRHKQITVHTPKADGLEELKMSKSLRMEKEMKAPPAKKLSQEQLNS